MYLHKKKYVYKINYRNINLKGGTKRIPNIKMLNLVPILYSFLDGKLNEELGYEAELCLDFLNEEKMYEIDSNIYRKQFNRLRIAVESIKKIIDPENFRLRESATINISENVKFDLELYFSLKKDLISNNFYFAQTGDHAISFYIEKIDSNHYNLVLINSGYGIGKYHYKYENYFNLWKSYNIKNEEIFYNILDKILSVNLVAKLFLDESFNKNYYNFLIYHRDDSFFKNLILRYDESEDKTTFILNEYYEILKDFESNNIDSKFFEINKLISFIDNWNFEKEKNNLNSQKEENNSSSSKSNNILSNENNEYIKAFFKSNSFIIQENNFLAQPQISGSCSWFSVFWLIIANLIKKKIIQLRL